MESSRAASLPGINVCVMKITLVVRKARNNTGFISRRYHRRHADELLTMLLADKPR